MDSKSLEFLSKFYNLDGDLVGERKKNFSNLLRNTVFSNETQRNQTLENLHPKSYQESLFRIDALIYFRRIPDLLQTLKEGNEVFISKILKQSWFFEEAFADITTHKFVNEFLPCLSYVVRLKVLRKVSKCWNEDKMDELFDSLNKRYGLSIAVNICHMCTMAKLKEIFDETEVRLRSNQVIHLFNRKEALLEMYLDHINSLDQMVGRCMQGYEDKNVLKHVALKNPKLLLDLYKLKKVNIEGLGRRTSETLIDLVIEDIPKHLDCYLKAFKNSVIVRKLGISFEILYKQIFPEDIKNAVSMYGIHNELLVHYPKHSRWNLFSKIFLEAFPMSIEELLQLLADSSSFSFLKLNPDRETTHQWARLKYAKNNYDGYLEYFKPSDCFDLIKNEMKTDSDNKYYLFSILLQNCKYNNYVFLERVLEYICLEYENIGFSRVSNLLKEICDLFDLSKFRKKHWVYIWELIGIARKYDKSFSNGLWSEAFGKSVEYLLKNGVDPKEILIDFIDFELDLLEYCFAEIGNKSVQHSVLIDFCDTSCDMFEEYDDFRNFHSSLIPYIAHFSIRCPDYSFRFSEIPHFVEIITATFEKTNNFNDVDRQVIGSMFCYKLVFPEETAYLKESRILELIVHITNEEKSLSTFKEGLKLLLNRDGSIFEKKILQVYFKNLYDKYPMNEIPQWFLRNRPRTLMPFFDKIVEKCLMNLQLLDMNQLKHYSHLGYDRKVCDFYKKQLCVKTSFLRTKGLELWALKKINILLSTDDLFHFINENFLPKKDKLDLEDEEMKEVYKLQCDIAKMLHNVIEPTKMLPLIMNFCRGDFLQPALRALYSLFHRSLETELKFQIEILSKQAVSARKHAMFLSCLILDQTYALNLMQNNEENNVSLEKYFFSATLKYFLKNPSQEIFDCIIENLPIIDVKNDNETLNNLTNICIPKKYRAAYIENCWKFFESSKGSLQIKQYLESILKCISIDIFEDFSFIFVNHLISSYFILPNNEKLEGFEQLIIRILEYRESEREYNIDKVLEILSKSDRTTISCFIQHFTNISSKDRINKHTTDIFIRWWTKYFSILDTFEENISLRILRIHLQFHPDESYAKNIVKYMKELIVEYGFHALRIFKIKLTEVIDSLSGIDKYNFFYNILKNDHSPQTCVLVLEMLQHSNRGESIKFLNIRRNIFDVLNTVNDPIVCVHYKLYLSRSNC